MLKFKLDLLQCELMAAYCWDLPTCTFGEVILKTSCPLREPGGARQ